MKIKSLELKNFRSYNEKIKIDFNDLNVIIGKNDIGKSTILEAMDIFFNEGNGAVKIEKDDINVDAHELDDKETIISVEFGDLPTSIIVDETVKTSLASEYLLTDNNSFILKKIYKNAGKPSTSIVAKHPTNKNCNNLLQSTNKQLKEIIEKNNIECENKTINSIMRKAIWSYFEENEELNLETVEIDITKGESKTIYDKVRKFLPIYTLFQADRKNDDSDSEIQDPLKSAIKEILSTEDIQEKLKYVADKVNESLKEVSDATLTKIHEMDETLSNTLNPKIPSYSDLKWETTFKNVSITGDNNIPINKRGSGSKRIILLNFFRAEAERKSRNEDKTNVIYAIEEPETSLHDDKQIQIIESFKELSKLNGTQVILTTHSSTVVKRMNFENLIQILKDENGMKKVEAISENIVPYPSLNEVNYLAFGDISEEYHNELYGIIEENRLLSEYKKGKRESEYRRKSGNKVKIESKIQSEIIRHQIHHPENKLNERYTRDQLGVSIELMRDFLIENYPFTKEE